MKNFSFKMIVENVENQKSLKQISSFIRSYFLTTIGKKGYGWREIPKNNSGFGAILRFENNDLALLKDGDFNIEKEYENSSSWPYNKSLKSTSFDYKQDKIIPIENLSREELDDVYNSIFNKIQDEMAQDSKQYKFRGD